MARQKLFKRVLINYQSEKSLAFKMRKKRAEKIKQLIESIFKEKGEVNIIDIGGTKTYWKIIPRDFLLSRKVKITLVNLPGGDVRPGDDEIFTHRDGNGCGLVDFKDKSFHLSHSNSVIEHVGDDENVRKFAMESKRVAEKYYLQTPNYWFPIEPHFVTPVYQWLPVSVRVWMLMHFNLGWYKRTRDRKEARAHVLGIRLMNRKQVKALFPDDSFHIERFALLAKSLIIISK